jgi:hypothetical protein
MRIAERSPRRKPLSVKSVIGRMCKIATTPLAAVWRLLARRRILAAISAVSILTVGLVVGTAGTAYAANSEICLTYDSSYCLAYAPNSLSFDGGVYGVSPSECNSANECSFTLIYQGYWDSQGVEGDEYWLQMAGTDYCVSNTSIDNALIGDAKCGANGTVWVADSNGATGYYLVSRYVLDTYHPGSLADSTIIVVYSPSTSGSTPYSYYEYITGGEYFGRWNFNLI